MCSSIRGRFRVVFTCDSVDVEVYLSIGEVVEDRSCCIVVVVDVDPEDVGVDLRWWYRLKCFGSICGVVCGSLWRWRWWCWLVVDIPGYGSVWWWTVWSLLGVVGVLPVVWSCDSWGDRAMVLVEGGWLVSVRGLPRLWRWIRVFGFPNVWMFVVSVRVALMVSLYILLSLRWAAVACDCGGSSDESHRTVDVEPHVE